MFRYEGDLPEYIPVYVLKRWHERQKLRPTVNLLVYIPRDLRVNFPLEKLSPVFVREFDL